MHNILSRKNTIGRNKYHQLAVCFLESMTQENILGKKRKEHVKKGVLTKKNRKEKKTLRENYWTHITTTSYRKKEVRTNRK
jgi:hypothetical protein